MFMKPIAMPAFRPPMSTIDAQLAACPKSNAAAATHIKIVALRAFGRVRNRQHRRRGHEATSDRENWPGQAAASRFASPTRRSTRRRQSTRCRRKSAAGPTTIRNFRRSRAALLSCTAASNSRRTTSQCFRRRNRSPAPRATAMRTTGSILERLRMTGFDGAAACFDMAEFRRTDRFLLGRIVAKPGIESQAPNDAKAPDTKNAIRQAGIVREPTAERRLRPCSPATSRCRASWCQISAEQTRRPTAPSATAGRPHGRAPRSAASAIECAPYSDRRPPRRRQTRSGTSGANRIRSPRPVSTVNSDHASTIRVIVNRAPMRSPIQPPGISNSA